jgi:hypothetical protein
MEWSLRGGLVLGFLDWIGIVEVSPFLFWWAAYVYIERV